MSYQKNPRDWHLLADRFIWYDDLKALSFIPDEISNEEVQQHLYTFHGDNISLEEVENRTFARPLTYIIVRSLFTPYAYS